MGSCARPQRIGLAALPACPKPARSRSPHQRALETREYRKDWRENSRPTVLRCPPKCPYRRAAVPHPKRTRSSLPNKQWVIGPLTSISRIVTNGSPFLVAKDGNHCAIQIKDETRPMLRQVDESFEQSIIGSV